MLKKTALDKDILSEKEQLPFILRLLDDPLGITWRTYNLIKRFDIKFTLRFFLMLFRKNELEFPIFIIGMPRSGSTTLFHILQECNGIGSIGKEGHDIWRLYHHPRYTGWSSDTVPAGKIGFGERKFIYTLFKTVVNDDRLLEKTADNLLRTEYLLELFPNAFFVVIKRNPCDAINSMINGWKHPHGKFRSYYLPEELNIPEYQHNRRWCSTLINGWRELTNSTIPEIAFHQWQAYVEAIDKGRELVPEAQWIEISFEDLVNEPQKLFSFICNRLNIQPDRRAEEKLMETISQPINALSPHMTDKWRTQNEGSILSLLPRIAPLAKKLGYQVNTQSGETHVDHSETS